jgi:hypothetical protein
METGILRSLSKNRHVEIGLLIEKDRVLRFALITRLPWSGRDCTQISACTMDREMFRQGGGQASAPSPRSRTYVDSLKHLLRRTSRHYDPDRIAKGRWGPVSEKGLHLICAARFHVGESLPIHPGLH